ncbi:MAG: PepSY domain-containing protein [Sphingopyxis sp.]|nr:PepSY domain-containing protein [Sphingopyxis sp.]
MSPKTHQSACLPFMGGRAFLLGLFLYLVVITGTVSVLAHEIGDWSISGSRDTAPFSQKIDARITELANSVEPRFREDVAIYPNAAGSLIVFFHTHGTNTAGDPDDLGVRFTLKPQTLEVLARDEGYGAELPSDRENALSEFITTLHISLHAPNPVGLYLTGLAGFVMLFAVISGIILHRHLLRDLFVAPRLSSRLLNKRDRHILAASWSLPFGFLLAFTGTFFSFAGSVGLPIVAMVSFGGDQTKMIETLVGVPQATSHAPADMTSLDSILAQSITRTGTQPDFVSIVHWGKANAAVQITHGPTGTSIEGSNHIYNLATGEYNGIKPDVGTRPSLGSAVFAWVAPLHFGHFAGLLSKFIWVALGLATCYVTLSGLRLWAARRHQEPGWRWLGETITVVAYGIPIGLVGAAFGFLAAYPAGNPVYWTAAGFVIATGVAIALAATFRAKIDVSRLLLFCLSGGLAALPLLRVAMGGAGWPTLVAAEQLIPMMIDIVLVIAGVAAFFAGRQGHVAQARLASLPNLGPGAAIVAAE